MVRFCKQNEYIHDIVANCIRNTSILNAWKWNKNLSVFTNEVEGAPCTRQRRYEMKMLCNNFIIITCSRVVIYMKKLWDCEIEHMRNVYVMRYWCADADDGCIRGKLSSKISDNPAYNVYTDSVKIVGCLQLYMAVFFVQKVQKIRRN